MKTYLTILYLGICILSVYAQNPLFEKKVLQELHNYKLMLEAENNVTENQQKYDVKYYGLDLKIDPTAQTLKATTEIICEVVSGSLDSLELDFWSGMTITDIHSADAPASPLSYSRTNDLLTVGLGESFSTGEIVNIIISYHGQPQNSPYNSFFFVSYNSKPMIFSNNPPYGARAWIPSKDIPSDKADSVDIRVTVPAELIVASNGALMQTVTQNDTTTYCWHEQYPISTYLISLAMYPYTVYYDNYLYNDNSDTMKIHFYMFPDHVQAFKAVNAKIKTMISVFSDLFGEYPFIKEKYGHAEVITLNGSAMENQTCTSFDIILRDYLYNDSDRWWPEWVFNHELAHQWWGDCVTQEDFRHAWLNEGITTYVSAFWYEYLDGPGAASDYLITKLYYIDPYAPGTIYLEDPTDFETVYNGSLRYIKPAWVLHTLRHMVGDSVFLNILRTFLYSQKQHYGTATTDEFQAFCEQLSGLDLDKFFQRWIYEEYYPWYSYGWSLRPQEDGYDIKLRLDQVQQEKIRLDLNPFWGPVDVKITQEKKDTTFVIWDSLKSQTFEFTLRDIPTNIELDPGNWILKEVQNDSLLPVPFAMDVEVDKTYLVPGSGVVKIYSRIIDPDNDNPEVTANIKSSDSTVNETIQLYDDGMHNDITAGDGLYGGNWSVIDGQRFYKITVKTLSSVSQFYNISNVAAHFTTCGPVRDSVMILGTARGVRQNFKVILTNKGHVSVNNLALRFSTEDPRILSIGPEIKINTLDPGLDTTQHSSYFTFINPYNADSLLKNPPLFRITVLKDNIAYWNDSVNTITDIYENTLNEVPNKFTLSQNYPNPFNPITTFEYSVGTRHAVSVQVNLSIYNLLSQKVATLVDKKQAAGKYQVQWDASGFASGVYYYRIDAGDFQQVKKMVLIK